MQTNRYRIISNDHVTQNRSPVSATVFQPRKQKTTTRTYVNRVPRNLNFLASQRQQFDTKYNTPRSADAELRIIHLNCLLLFIFFYPSLYIVGLFYVYFVGIVYTELV